MAARTGEDKLNEKQRRFVVEYLVDRNGARAAVAAGYSEKGAAVTATRLLSDINVAAALAGKRARMEIRTEITADRVLEKWAAVAFAGHDEPDPVVRAARLADPDPVRLKASELIAKHLGMLDTRLNVSVQHTQLGAVPPEELGRMLEALRARAREVLAGTEPLALPPVDVPPREAGAADGADGD